MKKLTYLLGTLFFFAPMVFASNVANEMPAACPSAPVIINYGLSQTEAYNEDGFSYLVEQVHHYETPQLWGFAIALLDKDARTPQQAMQVALQLLPSLSGAFYPVYSPEVDKWVCVYNSFPRGELAFAVEPIDPSMNMRALSKFHR